MHAAHNLHTLAPPASAPWRGRSARAAATRSASHSHGRMRAAATSQGSSPPWARHAPAAASFEATPRVSLGGMLSPFVSHAGVRAPCALFSRTHLTHGALDVAHDEPVLVLQGVARAPGSAARAGRRGGRARRQAVAAARSARQRTYVEELDANLRHLTARAGAADDLCGAAVGGGAAAPGQRRGEAPRVAAGRLARRGGAAGPGAGVCTGAAHLHHDRKLDGGVHAAGGGARAHRIAFLNPVNVC